MKFNSLYMVMGFAHGKCLVIARGKSGKITASVTI